MKNVIAFLKVGFLILTIIKAIFTILCIAYLIVSPPKLNATLAIWTSSDLIFSVIVSFSIYKFLSCILEDYEANGL